MSLGAVQQAAGSFVRAESEFNLFTNENSKRLRADNNLTNSRVGERNSRANEASESQKKTLDTGFQVKSADLAEKAAKAGQTSAILGLVSAAMGGFDNVGGIVSAGFQVIAAELALRGAQDEKALLTAQFGKLSAEADADQKGLKALDSNCYR